jgi:PTS system nitrogen regulatory IIA component
MLNLSELTEPALIDTDLGGTERQSVLQALASLVARQGEVHDPVLLVDRLAKRESLGSTGIGHGIAVPHCRMAGLSRVVLAIGICRQAIAFDALDGAPVRMFFLVISPEESPAAHLRCLAAIAHWVRDAKRREELFAISDPEALFRQLPGSSHRAARILPWTKRSSK